MHGQKEVSFHIAALKKLNFINRKERLEDSAQKLRITELKKEWKMLRYYLTLNNFKIGVKGTVEDPLEFLLLGVEFCQTVL